VGTISINSNGAYSFTPALNYNGPVPVITYTLSDGVGATDTSTLTINVTPADDPLMVVGSNSSDQSTGDNLPGTADDHLIKNPISDGDGNIVGGNANDVLVGDSGGYTSGSYNLTFMIDVSRSIDSTELAYMKAAINALLDKFAAVQNLHVDIGQFAGSAAFVGAYTTVATAQAAINGLQGSEGLWAGLTNYQAALTTINAMVGDDPAADHKLVYFLTDGDPTTGAWYSTDEIQNGMNGLSNISDAATAINHIEINAVGIALGDTSGTDTSATRLNAIDNTADGYLPVESFATLDLGSLLDPAAVGADHFVGGDGNDVIYGDAPNTDALAGNASGMYGAAGTHDGAGVDVL